MRPASSQGLRGGTRRCEGYLLKDNSDAFASRFATANRNAARARAVLQTHVLMADTRIRRWRQANAEQALLASGGVVIVRHATLWGTWLVRIFHEGFTPTTKSF